MARRTSSHRRRKPPTPPIRPEPPTPTIREDRRRARDRRRPAAIEEPAIVPGPSETAHEQWRLQQIQQGYSTHEAWRLGALRGPTAAQLTRTLYGVPVGAMPQPAALPGAAYYSRGTMQGPWTPGVVPTEALAQRATGADWGTGAGAYKPRMTGHKTQILPYGPPRVLARPDLDTGGGGGGYSYTPRRYTTGGGGVRGQAAVARGMGLVNWRIGIG